MSSSLLYCWDLLLYASFLKLYLLMTLEHYSIQIFTIYIKKYAMYMCCIVMLCLHTNAYNVTQKYRKCICVVLCGVLAPVVFADDSSDVN